jgi:hypothetical protein
MKKQITSLEWFPVPDYEGIYEINKYGTVRSKERVVKTRKGERQVSKHYMLTRVNNCGYRDIRLSKNGDTRTFFVHTLLARIFIPNPYGFPEVNHKNGNKLDNRIENLEWVNRSMNMKHAYSIGLIKIRQKAVVDKCTGREFFSTKQAAEFYGISHGTLRNYLNGNIRRNPTCLEFLDRAA